MSFLMSSIIDELFINNNTEALHYTKALVQTVSWSEGVSLELVIQLN
jgi:hypothetical protein